MRYYFAPLEGLTDSVYRRLHHRFFPGVDRYYMPFISPTVHRSLTPREARELPVAASEDFLAVPQLLTKVPEDFLWAARECRDRGYREINLNLGCPSGTVVSKGKGSGMLGDFDALRRFLDVIFQAPPLPISIKTRLGVEHPEDFEGLLRIYNDYPVKELTVHPRVRKDFYKGGVRMEYFEQALAESRCPVCYNGNLNSREALAAFSARFPQVEAVMIGRGLIGDPGMLSPGGTTADKLEAMFDAMLEEYLVSFGGSRNAMFRLKEHWRYLICHFENADKLGKRLRKTTDLDEYKAITHEIFHTLPLRDSLNPDW